MHSGDGRGRGQGAPPAGGYIVTFKASPSELTITFVLTAVEKFHREAAEMTNLQHN